MKVAAMQPYFFPYIGYFSLIHSVERFVFFDNVQFVRKSWMSRNRILSRKQNNSEYVHADLIKPSYRENLLNCRLSPFDEWKEDFYSKMGIYRNAPYYAQTMSLIDKIFDLNLTYLVDFNIESIRAISSYVNIEREFTRFSDESQGYEAANHPGQWGLIIAELNDASVYINAPGGEEFYNAKEFEENGITLGFVQPKLREYYQLDIKPFVPGLSIIDALMNNSPEKVFDLITSYKIKWTTKVS